MGRPIKKIFIGERGAGDVSGAGLASVTIGGTADTGIIDSDPLIISAPDVLGGTQAAGYVVSAAGDIDDVVITEPGDGYTSAPTVSVANIVNRTLTGVLALAPGIVDCTAFIEGGSNNPGDIKAQKGDITYRVTTSDGTGECSLVAATPAAAGEMAIIATDSDTNTYWVTKLYNNTVRLIPNTGTQFTAGDKVEWAKDGVAVAGYSVKITT